MHASFYLAQQTDSSHGLERFVRTVFPIIESKDIFIEAYTRLLSKRLLSSDSMGGGGGIGTSGRRGVCMDSEKSMVGLMKLQCGTSFTIKVEGMLADHSLAEDMLVAWTAAERRRTQEEDGEDGGEGRMDQDGEVTTTNQRIKVKLMFIVT